jgi:hypothetical protein
MSVQIRPCTLALLVLVTFGSVQIGVPQLPHKFPLDQFAPLCRAKGRVQDCPYDPVTKQVLAAGNRAIPVLISQLTETDRTRTPALDFWSYTTSGDVAFIFLTDLFTDKDLSSSTVPHVPTWEKIMSGCSDNAEACWRKYIRKNGIRSVQRSWQSAWERNRNQIVWDPESRCFRLRKVALTG